MVFSSLTFICVFLPVVFLLHQVLPGFKAKNALLIAASLVFYAYGEPVYIVLMVVSTLLNWAFGLLVGARSKQCKVWLGVAVVVNLALLAVFKYAGMLVATLGSLFGLEVAGPEIALPIGISFYTFQALSYVIDVYRGDVKAQSSYAKVLLYISFFPQLIAGPIVKYHDVELQLSDRHATIGDIAAGMRRFCIGLGKKVLIANVMAVAVDSVFGAELGHGNIAGAWIAALAYLMQIYFDFSGYSDMAIGMARMFGFTYQENFKYPYAATSIKVFWRRWHVSLSTWFRLYVYFPLGGNRKGRARTVFNKMVVFFLCGLWHGASWTFVVWGLIHGFFLLIEEYLPVHKLPKALGLLYTLLVVTIAFVLFRANSFEQGGWIIAQMFTGFHFDYESVELAVRQLNPLFMMTFAVALVAASPVKGLLEQRLVSSSDKAVQLAEAASYVFALALLVLSMLSISGGGYNPFIYFRF